MRRRATATLVGLALLSAGCAPEGGPPPTAGAPAAAPAGPIATQTALLVVTIPAGGASVTLDEVAVKPIPWRRAGIPFDAARHAPPGSALAAPTLTRSFVGSAPPQTGVLIAERPGGGAPFVLPLQMSHGGSAGDVVDPWVDGGGGVWRAPWFGPGTGYRVVRTSPGPPALLGQGP